MKKKSLGRKKKSNTSLVLSNSVITSRYSLTAMEIKTLFAIALKLQRNEPGLNVVELLKEPDDQMLYYTATEIANLVGIPKGSFQLFERVCERLMGAIITIRDPEKPSNWEKMTFLVKAKYEDGVIGLEPNRHMLPFYSNLTKNFTEIEFTSLMQFQSIYAIRIYTLIKQYNTFKPLRRFELDEFKKILGVEKLYKTIKDFKIRVLEPAKKELVELFPDLKFNYELIKDGQNRAYTHIVFYFDFKNLEEPVMVAKTNIEVMSSASECFKLMDSGRRCGHKKRPTDDEVCAYCFDNIRKRK